MPHGMGCALGQVARLAIRYKLCVGWYFFWELGICATIVIALAAPDDRTVVIVSWDGGKPSVIRDLAQRGELPTIRSMMADGSYTFAAETIVPSSTLPSHASMLTGLNPPGGYRTT